MKRALIAAVIAGGVIALSMLLAVLAGNGRIDVMEPAGAVAEQQRNLIIFTIALSALVVIPVFTLLFAFAWRYRASNSRATYKPDWAENHKLEALWWGIPIVIIAVLAVVTWQTSHSLDPYKKITSDTTPIEVEVVALQWKWLFIYPKQGVAMINTLPMPVDTPFEFKLTADAPMSAFWIPALGSQIYNMNGMTSKLNLIASKPGVYKGYTTNINGEGYADMVFDAKVTNRREFDIAMKQAREAETLLTMNMYKDLAEPSVIKKPRVYRVEPGLYQKIMAKYMDHGHASTSQSAEESATDKHTKRSHSNDEHHGASH